MEVMAKGETCISEETIKTGDGLKLLRYSTATVSPTRVSPKIAWRSLRLSSVTETCISEETIKTGDGLKLLSIYKSPLYNLDGSVMGTMPAPLGRRL